MTGLELSGRTIEHTRSTAISLNQHLRLCHSGSQEKNAKFVASIRRREHGAQVGGADNLRPERTSAKETKTSHTEECGEGSSGVEASASAGRGSTGAEGRKKQKPMSFCVSSTALTEVMLKQQNFVRRRVRHLHRLKPAERSGVRQMQAYNDAVQQGRGFGLGPPLIWAWAGLVQGLLMEGTMLGEVLAPLSDHMEEWNKLSIEERWGMVNVEPTRLSSHSSAGSLSPWRCCICVMRWRRRWKRYKERESKDRDLERHWHENFKTDAVRSEGSAREKLLGNVDFSGGDGR